MSQDVESALTCKLSMYEGESSNPEWSDRSSLSLYLPHSDRAPDLVGQPRGVPLADAEDAEPRLGTRRNLIRLFVTAGGSHVPRADRVHRVARQTPEKDLLCIRVSYISDLFDTDRRS